MPNRTSHRSNWTSRDIEKLQAGLASGRTPRDIARELGRTEEAVRRKVRLLDASPATADPLDYFRRRAREERERADQSNDARISAIHAKFAEMYDEVVSGDRESLSAVLRDDAVRPEKRRGA